MSLQVRLLSRSVRCCIVPKRCLSTELQKKERPETLSETKPPTDTVKVSGARKLFFVMAGLYKSPKDVPSEISPSTFSRNMDKFRIRASLLIVVICIIGALNSIFLARGVVGNIEEERERKQT